MTLIKLALVMLLALVNLAIAPMAFADPIAEKSPEYAEITQSLQQLIQAASNPSEAGYTAEELQQSIASLQQQKYIMEISEDWGVCRNETAQTLGVYAHRPQKKGAVEPTLYYLGAGQTTDDDWDCDGIYLPSGSNVALNPITVEALTEPVALKITDGTRWVITSNPDTGVIEFNLPPAQVLKGAEASWSIPDLAQADIDTARPNAPND